MLLNACKLLTGLQRNTSNCVIFEVILIGVENKMARLGNLCKSHRPVIVMTRSGVGLARIG
jgi:hypothetical protein